MYGETNKDVAARKHVYGFASRVLVPKSYPFFTSHAYHNGITQGCLMMNYMKGQIAEKIDFDTQPDLIVVIGSTIRDHPLPTSTALIRRIQRSK